MAEEMTLGVLRAEPAERGTEAEIRDGLLLARHPLDRQPAQQHESASLEQFTLDVPQSGSEARQRKARRVEAFKRLAAFPESLDRAIDLVELVLGEMPDPVVAAGELAAVPHTGSGDRLIIHARRIA